MEERCETCRYCVGGKCHRRAPLPDDNPKRTPRVMPLWVEVDLDDWCGEWKPGQRFMYDFGAALAEMNRRRQEANPDLEDLAAKLAGPIPGPEEAKTSFNTMADETYKRPEKLKWRRYGDLETQPDNNAMQEWCKAVREWADACRKLADRLSREAPHDR